MSKIDTHKRKVELELICANLGINCNEFNHSSYRLKKDGFVTIDIYVKSLKYFRHGAEWGFLEDITAFVTFEFKPKHRQRTDGQPIDYKAKYEKCIEIIKRFDAGIVGMYDL